MLDALFPLLLEAINGMALASFLEERTGISARTWRDGGPKKESTIARAKSRSLDNLRKKCELRDGQKKRQRQP